jgi:LmbE family N-acetylglucosaminyl deacetylase
MKLSRICCIILLFSSSLLAADAPTTAPAAKKKLTILAVAAHMDDAEFGMGGILIRAVQAGHRVVVIVTVSDYTTWGPTIGREAQCKADQIALAKRFGYEKRFLDYPYHQFQADNEAKKKIAAIYDELQPDIAFVQNIDDHWPDHAATGIAGTDAVLFAHGYTANRTVRRCPRVFAFCAAPGQTIRFEPDFYFDATPAMSAYMDLLAGTDACLNGKPPADQIQYEARNLKTSEVFRMSYSGWIRYCQCVQWGAQNGAGMTYGIGLKTIWGPRDGRPLWKGQPE